MTVKKLINPDKIIEGEPIVNKETALVPYRSSRPRAPRPIFPPSFFNSLYSDPPSFFQLCNNCVPQWNLEPWDLTLSLYDKDCCSCSLKRIVNRLYGRPEDLGLNTLLDCPHRLSQNRHI